MCFYFFGTVKVDTVYQKVLYNSCLLLFLRYGIQKTKERIQWGSHCVKSVQTRSYFWSCIFRSVHCDLLKKNNFCMINKIKLVWFYSLYRNYFFESKCVLLNIFHHVTLENISRMLNNFVYFQNIVVYNEALKTFTRNFQNTF